MWNCYLLINLCGTVEYVGMTINPKERFYAHTKKKRGKFYDRNDISMHIVSKHLTKKEAYEYEKELHKEYGLIHGESENHKKVWQRLAKNKRKLTTKQVEDIRSMYIKSAVSYRKLAALYNVSKGTIEHVIKNNIYVE